MLTHASLTEEAARLAHVLSRFIDPPASKDATRAPISQRQVQGHARRLKSLQERLAKSPQAPRVEILKFAHELEELRLVVNELDQG